MPSLRAENAAVAARDPNAADNAGRENIEFIALPTRGLRVIVESHDHDACNRGAQPGQDISQKADALNRDTGEPRRQFAAACRQHPAPKPNAQSQKGENGENKKQQSQRRDAASQCLKILRKIVIVMRLGRNGNAIPEQEQRRQGR